MAHINPSPSQRLILASQSPRRSLLLGEMGIAFDVMPAHADEWEAHDADPAELVRHNAELKARSVAVENPGRWVLASDTTVALADHVLNKPADLDEARAMLKRLSGRTHTVYTAVCLMNCRDPRPADAGEHYVYPASEVLDVVTSDVTFRELDDACITEYFTIVNPLDKAGAYGIQEGRELIIDHWEGSLHNIMGLPTEHLGEIFKELGLDGVFV